MNAALLAALMSTADTLINASSSILVNAPGVAGTVATSFDGYPLARQGHAGKALAIAAYASFSGGTTDSHCPDPSV